MKYKKARLAAIALASMSMLALIISLSTLAGAGSDLDVKLEWLDPADRSSTNSDALDFTPPSNANQITTLWVNLAANETFTPFELEIRLPKYIYEDRSGLPTGGVSLTIPEGSPIPGQIFYYYEDGDELVFVNSEEFPNGWNFEYQISYNFIPSNIMDGYENNNITVDYKTYGESTYMSSDPASVKINTEVKPGDVSKNPYKWEMWQTASWGPNPLSSDSDYYYVVWSLQYSQGTNVSTQPYGIVFADTQADGTIIGAHTSSTGRFTDNPVGSPGYDAVMSASFMPGTNTGITRYVLIRYLRPGGSTNGPVSVGNTVDVTQTGMDSGTETVSATSTYEYTYVAFSYPQGSLFSMSKTAGSASATTASGAVNRLLNDREYLVTSGAETYSFYTTIVLRNPVAVPGGANPNYASNPYMTVLLDDMVFLHDTRLGPGDYEITNCYLTFAEYEYSLNSATGVYDIVGKPYPAPAPPQYGTVELWYSTDNLSWTYGCDITRTATGYDYSGSIGTGSYIVSSRASAGIALPPGVVGVEFQHKDGTQYRVDMDAYVTVKLLPSNNVKSILTNQPGQLDFNLFNVSSLVGWNALDPNPANYILMTSASDTSVDAYPDIRDAVILHDTSNFGSIVLHQPARVPLTRYQAITSIAKTSSPSTPTQDTALPAYNVNYTIDMFESAYFSPSGDIDELNAVLSSGAFRRQREGTFYDLLPKGTAARNISAYSYGGADGDTVYSFRTVDNWQGSGRTMLIVDVRLVDGVPDYISIDSTSNNFTMLNSGFTLAFQLVNTYDNIVDNGDHTVNLAAYRSRSGDNNCWLNGGSPAAGIYDPYFASLENPNDDGDRNTVYASREVTFPIPAHSDYGIMKYVKSADDMSYSRSAEVAAGALYSYQLRFRNSGSGTAKNIVMYDVLENESGAEWKGTLLGIDVSQALDKGIAPDIYYSTTPDIDTVANPIGTAFWVQVPDGTDFSAIPGVTAIAVDLSKMADGSDYVFAASESIYCILNMRAATSPGLVGRTARNALRYSVEYSMSGAAPSTRISDPTTVILRAPDLDIAKTSVPASGTQSNPAIVGNQSAVVYTLTVENNERYSIGNVSINDNIPANLEISGAITCYFSTDTVNIITPGSTSSPVRLTVSGQMLAFTIDELNANQALTIVIPTTVRSDAAQDADIINFATITLVNGYALTKNSDTTYHRVGSALMLTGTKYLTGRALAGGEFEFTVIDTANGNTVATGANRADGIIDFSSIIYTSSGTYTYTVTENTGTDADITYDTSEYTVTVAVTFDSNGSLTTNIAYSKDGASENSIAFSNEYVSPDVPPPEDDTPPEDNPSPEDDPSPEGDPPPNYTPGTPYSPNTPDSSGSNTHTPGSGTHMPGSESTDPSDLASANVNMPEPVVGNIPENSGPSSTGIDDTLLDNDDTPTTDFPDTPTTSRDLNVDLPKTSDNSALPYLIALFTLFMIGLVAAIVLNTLIRRNYNK